MSYDPSVIGGKVLWEGKMKYVNPVIISRSLKYPGVLPVISHVAKRPRDHVAFSRKKTFDLNRRYSRSLIDVMEEAKIYEAKYNKYVMPMEPLFTDYGKEHVLPSTCDLGGWNSASTDLDNLGSLGLDTDVTYSKAVFDSLVKWYGSYVPKGKEPLSLSMVRGKFTGFPYMIGGNDRWLNNILLALCAAWTQCSRSKESVYSLDWLYSYLLPYHGDVFALEGSRQQHTSKEMAMVLIEGVFSSLNFNPRYRIINMDPKVSVMDIRDDIKRMLKTIKAHPAHTQNRFEIAKRIQASEKKDWFIVAIDQSKFDFKHGGNRGRQQINLHADVLRSERYRASAIRTFNTRFWSYAKSGLYEFPGDSMLKSGMGNTTLIGCTGNMSAVVASLAYGLNKSPESIIAAYGVEWDALMWGDDTVAMFKDKMWWVALQKGMTHFKLSVEAEPTIKYLGVNYSKGLFKGTMDTAYSVERGIQMEIYPERAKVYPFTTIGHIARCDLMGPKGKDFHKYILPHFEALDLGPTFTYENRHKMLISLLPEIQKRSDKIGQLDDVLQILTHGVSDLDLMKDDVDDVYLDLLGQSGAVDVTDPVAFLDKELKNNPDPRISKHVIRGIGEIASGNPNNYRQLLSDLTNMFKLQYNSGSVLY